MGSTATPYLILKKEKIDNPKEVQLPIHKGSQRKTLPNDPAPSVTNTEINSAVKKNPGTQKLVPPFNKENERAKMKMEFIKKKFEKSRERYQERKRMQEELDLKCEPILQGIHVTSYFNRAVSDLGSLRSRGANGGFPYIYFVVANKKISASDTFMREQFLSTSDKQRRQFIAQANKTRKSREKENVKIKSLAQELGLKSHPQKGDPIVKPENCSQIPNTVDKNTLGQKKVSHIIFPFDIISKPRNPVTAPATIGSSLGLEDRLDARSSELDEMRVHGKNYNSKVEYMEGRPKNLNYTMHTFDLPFIQSHQKQKTQQLNKLKKSDQQESSNKKVTFTKRIPVIRGNGFVVQESGRENLETLGLGPRSKSMPDINIGAGKSSCQKLQSEPSFLLQKFRRMGLPLTLPKIDIVSTVYVDMIMNIIKDYLHDPNTPSRQAQLARQLLVHLQAQELEKKKELIDRKEVYDDAVTSAPSLYQRTIKPASRQALMSSQSARTLASQSEKELEKHISVVKIKFKSKEADGTTQERSLSSHTGVHTMENRHAKDKNFVPVAPTCFKMAPPGLSRENRELAVGVKT